MTNPQTSPEKELDAIQTFTGMNPHILRVGIVVSELAVDVPFIPKQIEEITGINGDGVARNLASLVQGDMVATLPRAPENAHLRPHARCEHPHWQFFEDIKRQVGYTGLKDLFGVDWKDVPEWLRLTSGSIRKLAKTLEVSEFGADPAFHTKADHKQREGDAGHHQAPTG